MALTGYDAFAFDHDGTTRSVYRRGQGPGVVIIHEVPGITPAVERFANFVVDAGFMAFLPHLFGTPGKPESVTYIARGMLGACIRSEFAVLARRESSPITDWLRALCRRAHADCGGPGVGAIGMCLTGNFALSLMVDESVMAPILSQPSLPLPISASHRAALHLPDADLAVVKERVVAGCGVLGLRFTHDVLCPGARFDTLRRELGEGFEGIEIDSGPGNPHGISRIAHSVVTKDLVDEAGHPTRQALDRVLAVFRERLQAA
jgi:dienelactone hydrolase